MHTKKHCLAIVIRYLDRVEVISSVPFSTFWSSGPWNILSANKIQRLKKGSAPNKLPQDFRILATCKQESMAFDDAKLASCALVPCGPTCDLVLRPTPTCALAVLKVLTDAGCLVLNSDGIGGYLFGIYLS